MSPSPLKVLYSFPHRVGAPGIGTTALNQVRAMAELGADVTLICTSLHAPVPANVNARETLRFGGKRIPHRTFGSADRALEFHDWRVASALRRFTGRFDVVHTWPQSALATLAEARRKGCLSSREVPNTHTASAYAEALRESEIVGIAMGKRHSHRPNARHLRLEEREYAQADLLLVPSDYVARSFLERGVPQERLRRHQYGYDKSRFNSLGRIESPDRPFTAAFVGSAEPRKGLHYALDAWLRAEPPPGSKLMIAGGFVPGYREHLAVPLSHPSIEVLGFVDDIPSLLRNSDVLLLPSVEEGSALVTYEAQASGCIPLVSEAAGALLPDGVRDFVHRPRDMPALTEHLRRLSRDDTLRASMRREVIDWSSNLTWESAGRRMINIYADAVANHAEITPR
jgi:glycosyltransferase involved in cell wall biosynthesis